MKIGKLSVLLSALAMCSAASAQSSVTLYGLLDANMGSFKTNVLSGTSISSVQQIRQDGSGLNGNRWGLKGAEDLGGGLKAIFNIESGFSVDSGASTQGVLFGRRANVGLSAGFGTVELGRNTTPYDGVIIDQSMSGSLNGGFWGQSGVGDPSQSNNALSTATAQGLSSTTAATSLTSAQAFLSRTQSWMGYNSRINNSIKYSSPNVGGFTAAFLYGFGEDKTTTTDASNVVSIGLKYLSGPFEIGLAYQEEAMGGALASTSAVTITRKPKLQNAGLIANYDFGIARVGLGLNRAKYKDVTAPAALGGGDFAAQNEYALSVAIPVGQVTLSASYAVGKGDTLGKSSGFGLQALYPLSKRTTLYVGGVSTSTFDKLADSVRASVPGASIARNVTYAAGIRHLF